MCGSPSNPSRRRRSVSLGASESSLTRTPTKCPGSSQPSSKRWTTVSGSPIALDTSEAIAVLNNTGGAGDRIARHHPVFLPVPVLGKLLFGAEKSSRARENREKVHALLANCTVLPVTKDTAAVYARVRLRLKQSGGPIPENDVWIAAVCIEHDIPLATSDSHFSGVSDLKLAPRSA
ncbi:MAG: hypothetical protein DCC65_14635 [Planctomycetota bacterium]|nr:MAG: hypothetical protein DCC65_14635 [Planctomycetota bacterium]